MKLTAAFLSFIMIVTAAFKPPVTHLSGRWSAETKTTDFMVDLKQDGNAVTGSFISVQQNGKRVDDGKGPRENSITGTLSPNGIATVSFVSGYGVENKGTATIRLLTGGKLEWKITTPPKQTYYIPDHAVLSRLKK